LVYEERGGCNGYLTETTSIADIGGILVAENQSLKHKALERLHEWRMTQGGGGVWKSTVGV